MNYIGSKHSLLSFIQEVVENLNIENKNTVICDVFSGTAAVGKHFKKLGYSVISNDIQHFSYVTAKVFVENNKELTFDKLKSIGIDNPFDYLNSIKGRAGFIYKNYSLGGTKGKEIERLYFSDENAKKIDAIRLKINLWKNHGLLTEKEYYFLIAALVESSDKVANTTSVYEAFLKQLKPSALKPLVLQPLELLVQEGNNSHFALNEDGSELLEHVCGDVLYMDPPYNSRKYDTNYHILETIALYDSPKIKGKAGLRQEECKQSRFCMKKEAPLILEEMVAKAKFDYILLSYNNEGIIPMEKIEEIFSKYGEYQRFEKQHKRYKADNSRTYSNDHTIEYIHVLKKNK